MFKTILVPASGGEADRASLAAGLAIARRFDAHLEILHVRIDAAEAATAMAAEGATATLVSGLIERLEAEAEAREQRATALFDEFCRSEHLAISTMPSEPSAPSAEWLRETGSEPYHVTAYGRVADLIVLGRPYDGESFALDTIERALTDSGRPLLIPAVPAGAKARPAPMRSLPETAMIAWKPTREAARAVHAAMPLLALSKRIEIVTVAEDDETARDGIAARLLANLCWHGLPVSARQLRPGTEGAAAALLAAAESERALLVMGGYGHSRLREWIFGGFTERALAGAGVPILMAH